MKFSANLSMLFTELDMSERFAAAKQSGFDAVEIQFPYSESPDKLSRELTSHRMQLILFNVDADDLLLGGEGLASVPQKKKQFKESVLQTVAYAKILKPRFINVLPGRCFDCSLESVYLETFKDNLRFALEKFTDMGIVTLFEAINTFDMPGFIIHNGAQMLSIFHAIDNPSLKMQYDIYHMHRMGEPINDFIKHHLDKIGHIQFADSPGRNQPGTGTIDFATLFRNLESMGYNNWLGAEYKPSGPTEQSLNWLQDWQNDQEL